MTERKPAETAGAAGGLAALLRDPVALPPEREAVLRDGLNQGLAFFEEFNEARLKLAFSCFDAEMKKALYEVIFLLHVNDPALKEYHYSGVEMEKVGGVVREKPFDGVADLYVEGAPHGVQGVDKLSGVFREEFAAHIQSAFNLSVVAQSTFGYCPIVSIHSLGSIGTMGHKSRASDLDLQVQYELEPFLLDASRYSDAALRELLMGEVKYRMGLVLGEKKASPEAAPDAVARAPANQQASHQVIKAYPLLYRYLIKQEGRYTDDLAGPNGRPLRGQLAQEVMTLIKRASKVARGEEMAKLEKLLQERLKRIQEYLGKRFPNTELYLFSCSNDDYRQGHHGSTLTNKEASGSAYELILNYETLMPGIQITPMVPTHFVLPRQVNNDAAAYERTVDYIRFGMLPPFKDVRPRLVNLGATPDMEISYVAKHSGAVYWEAFKASSGNLPKAILNLFRFEMLLDRRYLKTNIQIIKDPAYLNQFVTPRPTDMQVELEQIMDDGTGIPPWALLEMESRIPMLLKDPWWQRYKALKIAFGEPTGIEGLGDQERRRISKLIDTAFALHVRISDVFSKSGEAKGATYRDHVLVEFLKRSFPPISPKRKFLERLFMGEVASVNQFELEMRGLFKSCLKRVNQKIAALNIQGASNQHEFEIWFHYYQSNFEPPVNVVPRTILKHLMVSRGRIQIGFRLGEGWFFQSVQKEGASAKRFDTSGYLDHLPETVVLREKCGFLEGLADCVFNGYYGVLNPGTLRETRTVVEFDAKSMDLGSRVDNTLAFLRPDDVHHIVNGIGTLFKYRPYHYMDCIAKKREVREVFLFLNMMKLGRLSVLYRDNLLAWYCEEWEHPEVFNRAYSLKGGFKPMLTAKPVHITLAKFFKSKHIDVAKVDLAAWVNPNSVDAGPANQQIQQKEKLLSEEFLKIVRAVHTARPAAPAAAS
jgi:hypothetical protein